MSHDNPPPSFYGCCCIEIDGDNLTVSCKLRDPETGELYNLEKTYDLRPLTNYIARRIRAHHASLHGDTEVAGLGSFLSKAKNAAKRIASSKGVKELWKKVKPLTQEFIKSAVPGGAATYALAEKTYNVVEKAAKGDKRALAELKSVATKAAAGNPLAREVMKTAKVLNNAQKLKNLKSLSPLGRQIATRATRGLTPLVRPSADAKDYETAIEQFENIDYADESAAADDIRAMANEGADITDMVEGWKEWGFSRKFRSPLQSIADQSPGIGFTARSLYSDGLETMRKIALARSR